MGSWCRGVFTNSASWAAGPAAAGWDCPPCGGLHSTDLAWTPTGGNLGASYARSLEIEDAKITAENDQRLVWNREEAQRRLERPQMRPRTAFKMSPLASTLHPTLASFVKACTDSRWFSSPTDQVPEWPGQEAAFRATEDGQFLVLRISHAKSLKPEPRLV